MALIQLSDGEAETWRKGVSELIEVDSGYSAFFRLDMLKQKKWRARIFERQLKGFALQTVARISYEDRLYKAVCLDIDRNGNTGFMLDLNVEDLDEIRRIYFSPSIALIERNLRFAIVSDCDYYWGIAGESRFVDRISQFPGAVQIGSFLKEIAPYENPGSIHFRIASNMKRYAQTCGTS